MSIFKLDGKKLQSVQEIDFDLESQIQKLTEENLHTVFGVKFISGATNSEFSVAVQEQTFYIDTLAFDEKQKSFVIIEYKKEKNFSVIDQGFAYLSALLHNKAEFVLELNRRLGVTYDKKDIDWEQTRLIFISPEFTNYQRNAINFRDLPFFLYEVRMYDNGIIEYDALKPLRTSESIQTFTKDKIVSDVSKEIKVYTLDDLVKPEWTRTQALLATFEKQLMQSQEDVNIRYTKKYIVYASKHGRNYAEIVPQERGLKVYYRFPHLLYTASSLTIHDCSKIGHWTNGLSYVYVQSESQVQEAVKLAQESYQYLHKDVMR